MAGNSYSAGRFTLTVAYASETRSVSGLPVTHATRPRSVNSSSTKMRGLLRRLSSASEACECSAYSPDKADN